MNLKIIILISIIFVPINFANAQNSQRTLTSFELRTWFSSTFIAIRQIDLAGGESANPDGCSSASSYQFDNSHSQVDAMISNAMAAQYSGRNVEVVINGCTAAGRPKIVAVWASE